ncbi:putative membrane protein [Helicobacter pylori Hp H-18]|nr:putative membrane protein [Helicobacter pylori Hp H-18]
MIFILFCLSFGGVLGALEGFGSLLFSAFLFSFLFSFFIKISK